jgi:hypothetical protein
VPGGADTPPKTYPEGTSDEKKPMRNKEVINDKAPGCRISRKGKFQVADLERREKIGRRINKSRCTSRALLDLEEAYSSPSSRIRNLRGEVMSVWP